MLLVSLAGCLYIGWLAACAILEEGGRRTTRDGFLSGLLIGISNPKDIIFFVSFFPQFIGVTDSVERSMILLSAIWIAVDLLVLGAYIFFLGRVVSKRYHRTISLVSAMILLAIAVLGFAYNIVELRQMQRCATVVCL
ncbi:conserved membrane hypothetical protein [Pseudomonas sp. OF001]|nr:conserved membrane hypothetical protein [Pseudomonas sp. OF001]